MTREQIIKVALEDWLKARGIGLEGHTLAVVEQSEAGVTVDLDRAGSTWGSLVGARRVRVGWDDLLHPASFQLAVEAAAAKS